MQTNTELNKVIRLGTIPRLGDVFCKIEIKNGKLSICGVEGPMSNGDARGSCGQIEMHLRGKEETITPAPGWTLELMRQFFDTWDKWHLNDMRPGCRHQIGPEWTPKDVTLYHFRLKTEITEKQNATKELANAAICRGETFTPTLEQSRLAILDYAYTYHSAELPARLAPYYEPKMILYAGDTGATEIKKTNWLRQDEHPEGYLSKPCPICGYKYGSQWLREELPALVVSFLKSLPDTDKNPAWV